MARLSMGALCLACALLAANGNPINTYTDGVQTPGSVTNCDTSGNTDYFPDKIPAVFAKFSVEYFKYYKIVTVTAPVAKKYLLVQRGCPQPFDVTADLTLTIPLTSVAISSQTWHKFVEASGERGAIKGINGLWSTSPCINKLMIQDQITDMSKYSYSEALGYHTVTTLADGNRTRTPNEGLTSSIDAHLIDGLFSRGKNGIIVGDSQEATYQAMNEWLLYIAAFFNKEAMVDEFAKESRDEWVCESTRAETDKTLKAVWVNYLNQDFGETSPIGWIISLCKEGDPSYRHCELITAAGGVPVKTFAGTKETSPSLYDKGNGQLLGVSDADMVAYAQDADLIVLANQYCSSFDDSATVELCDAKFNAIVAKLAGTKAHTNKNIYDIGRKHDPTGGSAIFEATVEPQVLLSDMIKVLNTDTKDDTTLVFLRNVFTEGVGNQRKCSDYPTAVGCIPDRALLASICPNAETTGMQTFGVPCSGAAILPSLLASVAAAVLVGAALLY